MSFNVNRCLYPVSILTSEKVYSELLTKTSQYEAFIRANHTCFYCPRRTLHTKYKFQLKSLIMRSLNIHFKLNKICIFK